MQVNIRCWDEFGTIGTQGVHQLVETGVDLDNAIYNADRDGYEVIWLYVANYSEAKFYAECVAGMLPDAFLNVALMPERYLKLVK